MPKSLVVGSQEHKELFCRFFLDTHVAFDPATVDWPEIDEASRQRLHSLPVWAEAIATERMTTCIIETWAPLETDPLIRQAVALQGYEEARHAAIIQGLITRYGIAVPPPRPHGHRRMPSGPSYVSATASVLTPFSPSPCLPLPGSQAFSRRPWSRSLSPSCRRRRATSSFLSIGKRTVRRGVRSGSALCICGVERWAELCKSTARLHSAIGTRRNKDFTMQGHQAISMEITPRRFLELCLAENAQRLDRYDARLLRPRLVPSIAQALCRVLR